MNEQITQLAVRAGLYVDLYGKPWPKSMSAEECNAAYQKFAELIVQECGNWFNGRLVVEPDYGLEHRVERNQAVVGVMKEFNQHFGVESQARFDQEAAEFIAAEDKKVASRYGYFPKLHPSEWKD